MGEGDKAGMAAKVIAQSANEALQIAVDISRKCAEIISEKLGTEEGAAFLAIVATVAGRLLGGIVSQATINGVPAEKVARVFDTCAREEAARFLEFCRALAGASVNVPTAVNISARVEIVTTGKGV